MARHARNPYALHLIDGACQRCHKRAIYRHSFFKLVGEFGQYAGTHQAWLCERCEKKTAREIEAFNERVSSGGYEAQD